MPEPPAWTSTVSPGSSLALSNSMCCTVAKAIGAQAASRKATPAGTGITSRAGMLTRSRAKPSTWKPMMPPTFSHRLSRPARQACAGAAGQCAVHDHRIAGLERARVRADRGDLAGRLDADHERKLALGEGHAAIAPQIEVIERHRLDADLHLARRRRARARGGRQARACGRRSGSAPACVTRARGSSPATRSGRRSRTSSTARAASWRRAPRSAPRRAGSPDRGHCS